MSLVNYTVKLPKVDVPEDWTNFSRKLIVRNDNARANSSTVLLEKDADGDEQSFSVSAQEGTDISVSLDLKNDQPTLSFRRTAGKFVAYESDDFQSLGKTWLLKLKLNLKSFQKKIQILLIQSGFL